MTGSVPVGFKAQRWKKEWGFYNIIKEFTRVQVDITGHEFTDGGLLANFPIKYLDNKKINLRYYSHITVTISATRLIWESHHYINNKAEYKDSFEIIWNNG